MIRPLIVNPEAEADLADARAWYERQRRGLGDELLECVEEVFHRLRGSPELFGRAFEELRLARVRRFPYLVVFRVDEDQVTVVAIYHARRDPRGWQDRASPGPTDA
jgi:plasmid stabilization system protein ParE